jgi:hypothetical protein
MKRFVSGFASELVKIAFNEGWNTYIDTPSADIDNGPILSEQYIPQDVEAKSIRQDYFLGLVMPQSSGKITSGKLGTPMFAQAKKAQ